MLTLKSTLLLALLPLTLASPVGPVKNQLFGSGDFSSNTQNGLSGSCRAVTVIFARGTNEGGNVGTSTGPPFFQALVRKLGDGHLAVQGVDYGAKMTDVLKGGDPVGSARMSRFVMDAFSKCPETKVVLSGYSQGALLVHNAAKLLSKKVARRITAVVTFGDPTKRQDFPGISPSRTKVICHEDDQICHGGVLVTSGHLTYGRLNAEEAADYVVAAVKRDMDKIL